MSHILSVCVGLTALATASPALADTTFGSDVNGTPPTMGTCIGNPGFACVVVPTSLPSAVTTSPCTGTISRFRINGIPSINTYRLRVVRLNGNTATAVSSSSAVSLSADGVNTFPVSLPIEAGDYLGLDFNQSTEQFKVRYRQPGTDLLFKDGIPESGSTMATGTDMFLEYLFNADVACATGPPPPPPVDPPSNAFTFGKLTRNKKRGTAKLAVDVPGPGTITLSGAGVKAQRPAVPRTARAKPVTAAGTVQLTIKPTGKAKKKLKKKGKAKVKVSVTFTPDGGTAATQSKKLKLKRKRKL